MKILSVLVAFAAVSGSAHASVLKPTAHNSPASRTPTTPIKASLQHAEPAAHIPKPLPHIETAASTEKAGGGQLITSFADRIRQEHRSDPKELPLHMQSTESWDDEPDFSSSVSAISQPPPVVKKPADVLSYSQEPEPLPVLGKSVLQRSKEMEKKLKQGPKAPEPSKPIISVPAAAKTLKMSAPPPPPPPPPADFHKTMKLALTDETVISKKNKKANRPGNQYMDPEILSKMKGLRIAVSGGASDSSSASSSSSWDSEPEIIDTPVVVEKEVKMPSKIVDKDLSAIRAMLERRQMAPPVLPESTTKTPVIQNNIVEKPQEVTQHEEVVTAQHQEVTAQHEVVAPEHEVVASEVTKQELVTPQTEVVASEVNQQELVNPEVLNTDASKIIEVPSEPETISIASNDIPIPIPTASNQPSTSASSKPELPSEEASSPNNVAAAAIQPKKRTNAAAIIAGLLGTAAVTAGSFELTNELLNAADYHNEFQRYILHKQQ